MRNEFGVDETYEAFVADVHPKFKKTGCSSGEALQAQKQICPAFPFDTAQGKPPCPGRTPGSVGVVLMDYCRINKDVCKLAIFQGCTVYDDYLVKVGEGK